MYAGSCPRRETRPTWLSRPIGQAVPFFLPIVLTLILLPLIAFASPPDPSWIAGVYDGADGDDIVTFVYETSGSDGGVLSHMPPLPWLTETLFEGIVHRLSGGQSAEGSRSPPTIVPFRIFNSSTDYMLTTSPSLTPVTRIHRQALSVRTELALIGTSACPPELI